VKRRNSPDQDFKCVGYAFIISVKILLEKLGRRLQRSLGSHGMRIRGFYQVDIIAGDGPMATRPVRCASLLHIFAPVLDRSYDPHSSVGLKDYATNVAPVRVKHVMLQNLVVLQQNLRSIKAETYTQELRHNSHIVQRRMQELAQQNANQRAGQEQSFGDRIVYGKCHKRRCFSSCASLGL